MEKPQLPPILQGSKQTRRLDRAVDYVSDYWFPVNPALLSRLKTGAQEGVYDLSPQLLVAEIKNDFALFTYSLRKLVQMLRDEGVALPAQLNPVQLLEASGIERLKAILEIDEREVSRHSIALGNEYQAGRFKEAMLSASAAETLAEKFAIDSDAAFSAALLRQLGHTLIAWNYPGVYADAIIAQKDGETFDLLLTKFLGFSPQALALRLLSSWGLTREHCASLAIETPEEQDEEQQIISAIGSTLGRLCRIGEAFARANDPEHYPSARDDWEVARIEIESALGERGLAFIREKFAEHCEEYLTILPHVFQPGLIVDREQQIRSEQRARGNPFLRMCSPEVQSELRSLYSRLNSDYVDRENVHKLLKDILPRLGYCGGCVYTIDPGLILLVPQAEVGTMRLRALRAVDYSISRSNSDMIAVAFQSSEPVVGYHKDAAGETFTALAGYFGLSQRVGVLYLETADTVPSDPDGQPMIHFKAICHALSDCMNL